MYEPDKNLQGQLTGFIDEKVFVEDEDGNYDTVIVNLYLQFVPTIQNL